jgi:hypothetical protein
MLHSPSIDDILYKEGEKSEIKMSRQQTVDRRQENKEFANSFLLFPCLLSTVYCLLNFAFAVAVFTLAFVGILESAKVQFSDPNIPNGEKLIYRITEGRENSELIYEIERKQNEGNKGKWTYVIKSSTFYEMTLHTDDMKPILIKRFTPQGELEFSIAYRSGRVHFTYPGPKRNKVDEVPNDSYDVHAMMYVLRGFPFEKEKKVEFTLVTPDRKAGVYAKLLGTESVTTPIGSINCYKLEAGVSGLLSKVVPYKFYFWYDSAPPYRLIKTYDTKDQRTVLIIKQAS